MSIEVLTIVLSSGIVVQFSKGIWDLIMWNKARKASKEDNDTENLRSKVLAIETNVNALMHGMKWNLYDTIKKLSRNYCQRGFITEDELICIREMHQTYKDNLGNGKLDPYMERVEHLFTEGHVSIDTKKLKEDDEE